MPQGLESTAAMWTSPKGSGPAGRYLKVAAILEAVEAHHFAQRSSDFARAWEHGRAMALEDWTKVIDFALGG